MITTKIKILTAFIIITLFSSIGINAQKIRSLRKQSVLNLRLEYDKSITRINNSHIPIGISVLTEKQLRLTTKGYSKGNLRWANFKIKADSAKFSNGTLSIPYFVKPPKKIELTITLKFEPDKAFKETIWLNQLTSIQINSIIKQSLSPGNTFKISLNASFNNGITQSFPLLTNQIKKNLHLSSKIYGGELYNGKITITDNIDEILNHSVYLYLGDESNPDIKDSMQVTLDYNKQYSYSESGSSGFGGFSGSHGSSGSSGSSAGDNGNNGNNGCIGDDGENGTYGADIDLFADAYYDSILQTTLIYIEIGRVKKYLINPIGGRISIFSMGGNGGSGGNGGDGGNGGKGADGFVKIQEWKDSTGTHQIIIKGCGGNGGYGGMGGMGGYGGNGGNGGNITINYTKKMKPYLNLIIAESKGGEGGNSGRGGNKGSGGTGGSGNPSGYNGSDGQTGQSGRYGENGRIGFVDYIEVRE